MSADKTQSTSDSSFNRLLMNAGILHVKIKNAVSGVTVDGQQNIVAAALHQLSISHYYSLLILFGMKRRASALALVRPCTDAAQRSLYVYLSESTDLLDKVSKDHKHAFGYQQEMVDLIHEKLGEPVLRDVNDAYSVLCSYTHGGLKQIDRQITAEGLLEECVSDGECEAALITTTFPIVFTTYLLSRLWHPYAGISGALLTDYVNLMPVPSDVRHLVQGSSMTVPVPK